MTSESNPKPLYSHQQSSPQHANWFEKLQQLLLLHQAWRGSRHLFVVQHQHQHQNQPESGRRSDSGPVRTFVLALRPLVPASGTMGIW